MRIAYSTSHEQKPMHDHAYSTNHEQMPLRDYTYTFATTACMVVRLACQVARGPFFKSHLMEGGKSLDNVTGSRVVQIFAQPS